MLKKGISSTMLPCVGKAYDTSDVIHDLRDKVASLADTLSQMGASSQMPFCFAQSSRLPSEKLYHLSVYNVTQPMKIRCSIAYMLEWL